MITLAFFSYSRNTILEAERDQGTQKNEELEKTTEALRKKVEELKDKNGDLLEKLSKADLEKERLRARFKRKLKKLRERVKRSDSNEDKEEDGELEEEERQSKYMDGHPGNVSPWKQSVTEISLRSVSTGNKDSRE